MTHLVKTHKVISGTLLPFSGRKCVNKAKILRRIATANDNVRESIKDRISKSNIARVQTRRGILGIDEININIKLRLSISLICSILAYSLHIIPRTANQIDSLQHFYSKCIRRLVRGFFTPETMRGPNTSIRRKYGIPNTDIKLKLYKLITYYKCKQTISTNYRNGETYIGNELQTLDHCAISLQENIHPRPMYKTHDAKIIYIFDIPQEKI